MTNLATLVSIARSMRSKTSNWAWIKPGQRIRSTSGRSTCSAKRSCTKMERRSAFKTWRGRCTRRLSRRTVRPSTIKVLPSSKSTRLLHCGRSTRRTRITSRWKLSAIRRNYMRRKRKTRSMMIPPQPRPKMLWLRMESSKTHWPFSNFASQKL